jgi:hypothetical protein
MTDKKYASTQDFGQTETEPEPEPKAEEKQEIPTTEKREIITKETRQKRSVDGRRQVGEVYRPKIFKAAGALIAEDSAAIRTAVKRYGNDKEALTAWLKTRYSEEMKGVASRTVGNILTDYGNAIVPVVIEEIDNYSAKDFDKFLSDYVDGFTTRYLSRSSGQIVGLIKESEEKEDSETHEDLINTRLDEWGETRAGKIQMEEVARGRSAFAKAAYVASGVTLLRWVANGKSCPYCSSLDGQVVGVEESFISKGEEFQPEGAEVPLAPSSNIGHAPAHAGCDCDIVSEG